MSQPPLIVRAAFYLVAISVALGPSVATATEKAPVAVAEQLAPPTVDVVLHHDRLLIGQLVGAGGKPAAETKVRITLADGREAEATTNAEGGFAFEGVKGLARLESDKSLLVTRCWTKEAAPPSATPAVLLVEEGAVARGQRYAGSGAQGFVTQSKRLFANPLFVAGVIGTAVAIPVAIHNSDDDDPAS